MTRTVAQLAASGRGRVAHLLEVCGYPYCFASVGGWTPTDSWYTTRGYDGVYGWLQPVGIDLEDLSRFIEGDFEVPGLELSVVDVDGAKTAMLKSHSARVSSRITAPFGVADGSVTMISASSFPPASPINPKRAWAGLEAFSYTGKTATALTGCTRGVLGTVARAYDCDDTIEPPVGILITDGPTDIRGRACRVHMAVWDDDERSWGPTTVIYRGFVGTALRVGRGVWRIPLEHCSTVFSRSVGQGLPSAELARRQYWYLGTGFPGLSSVEFTYVHSPASSIHRIIVPTGHYGSPVSLARALADEFAGAGAAYYPRVVHDYAGGDRAWLWAPAVAGAGVRVTVRIGDPLWALGFEPGTYESEVGVAWEREAESEPRLLVVDWSAVDHATEHPQVKAVSSAEAAKLSTDLYAQVPGNAYAMILQVAGQTVTLGLHSQDQARPQQYWTVESDDDLVLQHVIALYQSMATVLKRCVHLLAGQAEPEQWCAMGLTSDDVDWDELDAALAGAPAELLQWRDAVVEEVAAKDLVAARLGLLGVAPRITDAGRIGWARIETPITLAAHSVEVDATVWSGPDAPQVEAELGGEALITQAICRIGYDYRRDGWGRGISITWDDGIAERGRTRAIKYELRGLIVHPTLPGHAPDRAALRAVLVPWMTGLHYGLFGRLAAPIDLGCTWTAKQLRSGDVVLVTHPCVPDLPEGEIGVEDRLAIVYGRVQPTTTDKADVLRLRFGPVNRASGISPSALGDGWDGLTKMTFSGADTPLFAQAGGNDLAEFAEGDRVLLWAWDTDPCPVGYPKSATIDEVSVASKSVTFTGDPFGGAGLPASGAVWMTYPDWDDMTAAQQQWLAIASTGYVLGDAGVDPGFEWGV